VTEYAILGALLLRALGRELPAFALGLGYAITDEIHQHFVQGRHGAPLDVAIDAGGLMLGILILRSATARASLERRLGWQERPRRIERDG
jgi:VanZ family protein